MLSIKYIDDKNRPDIIGMNVAYKIATRQSNNLLSFETNCI